MIRALTCLAVALSAVAALAEDTWQPLFNGRDLTGWTAVAGPIESWTVADGVLSCSGAGGGWLSTKDEFDNFEFALEFRVTPGGNSGVFIRSPHEKQGHIAGMEIQILDDEAPQYAKLKSYQYCGGLYLEVAPSKRVSKPAGEWQSMQIKCDRQQVQVTLNGTQIIDADLTKLADHAVQHPGIKRTTGYIGLQNHGTRVDFRNVRVKRS